MPGYNRSLKGTKTRVTRIPKVKTSRKSLLGNPQAAPSQVQYYDTKTGKTISFNQK